MNFGKRKISVYKALNTKSKIGLLTLRRVALLYLVKRDSKTLRSHQTPQQQQKQQQQQFTRVVNMDVTDFIAKPSKFRKSDNSKKIFVTF